MAGWLFSGFFFISFLLFQKSLGRFGTIQLYIPRLSGRKLACLQCSFCVTIRFTIINTMYVFSFLLLNVIYV